jgi:hypothetical protein
LLNIVNCMSCKGALPRPSETSQPHTSVVTRFIHEKLVYQLLFQTRLPHKSRHFGWFIPQMGAHAAKLRLAHLEIAIYVAFVFVALPRLYNEEVCLLFTMADLYCQFGCLKTFADL